jgi:hypothetical protein
MKRHYPHRFDGPRPLIDVPLCGGKVAYSTFTAARAAAGRTRVDAGDEARLQPYLCRWCHRFHVCNTVAPKRFRR